MIWKDLKTMLSEGLVTFTFKKVNGELRTDRYFEATYCNGIYRCGYA